jgi:hypothetical protein
MVAGFRVIRFTYRQIQRDSVGVAGTPLALMAGSEPALRRSISHPGAVFACSTL